MIYLETALLITATVLFIIGFILLRFAFRGMGKNRITKKPISQYPKSRLVERIKHDTSKEIPIFEDTGTILAIPGIRRKPKQSDNWEDCA
jgi:hypothetical protein